MSQSQENEWPSAQDDLDRLRAENSQLRTELGEMSKELERADASYEQRLGDIAELGRVLCDTEAQLRRLRALHNNTGVRQHILTMLAATKETLHSALGKPYRLRAYRRAKRRAADEVELVRASGLFDADWYLGNYADVDEADVDPLLHFVMHGGYELRSPGPDFDSFAYHKAYPDVTAAGMVALIHYLRNGKAENRKIFKPGARH